MDWLYGNDPLSKTSDSTRSPLSTWAIGLAPLWILIGFSIAIYFSGYRHARALSESLVPVQATLTSVKEEMCGGRSKHVCYRVELHGTVDGVEHTYQSYAPDKTYSEFINTPVKQIFVPRHVGTRASPMYWTISEPVENFETTAAITLGFIAFQLAFVLYSFWKTTRSSG